MDRTGKIKKYENQVFVFFMTKWENFVLSEGWEGKYTQAFCGLKRHSAAASHGVEDESILALNLRDTWKARPVAASCQTGSFL